MPGIKFQGFSTGSAVEIAAVQGAQSANGSVATWAETGGGSSNMTLSISANRISGVAPMGALFSADATSTETRVESPYHDIEGLWSYGDPGNFTSLGDSPLWGTDWNVGYGPRGTHVFSEPGTYTVSHTAYDGTGSRSDTMQITVEDPDVVFVGTDTAVVSSSGNFAGAPSGASEFTTLAAALSHLSGRQNQRLLIRYDETHTDAIEFDERSGSGRRVFVGRFGHGSSTTRPLLDMSGSQNDAISVIGDTFDEITICDLRIQGGYDPTATSQPSNPDGSGINFTGPADDKCYDAHKTVWNVDIENIGNMGIDCDGRSGDNKPNRRLYLGNTRIIGWYNYGILSGDGGEFGFSGVTIQQPTGTVNGQGKGGPVYWPDHGPFRLSRPNGMMVMSNCEFTSFNDWSAGSSSQTFQDIFRWNSGGSSSNGTVTNNQELVIDRFRGEGGTFQVYNATGGGQGVTDNWVVVDRWHFIHADLSKHTVNMPMGGCTVRNGVAVIPNVPPGGSTGIQRMFSDNQSNYYAGAQTRRAEFYSNALIDLRSDANARSRNGDPDSKSYTVGGYQNHGNAYFGNNLLHAPNMVTGGEAGHAPLADTPQWNVLYDGERWEEGAVDTSRAYGNAPTASFVPEPGSPAIGGASGKVSILDFHGNLREDVLASLSRSNPSEGPYEPLLEN